jgi:hypothetical protein
VCSAHNVDKYRMTRVLRYCHDLRTIALLGLYRTASPFCATTKGPTMEHSEKVQHTPLVRIDAQYPEVVLERSQAHSEVEALMTGLIR